MKTPSKSAFSSLFKPSEKTTNVRVTVALSTILVLLLLSVVLFSYQVIDVSTDAVKEQAMGQVEASALGNASAIEQEIGRLADSVEAQANRESVQEALEKNYGFVVEQTLKTMEQNSTAINAAFATDPSGILTNVLPLTPGAIGQDFSYRDWYHGVTTQPASEGPYISRAFKAASTGNPFVIVAATQVHAVGNPEEVVGIIGVGETLDSLQRYVDTFAERQNISLTITDQAGVIVAAPGGAPVQLVSIKKEPGISEALSGQSSVEVTTQDDVEYLTASAPVETYGWTVTAEVPAEQALAGLASIRRYVTAAAFVRTLIIVLGLAAVAVSMKRRAKTASALAQSEAFLASVVDNIPTMVFVKTADDLAFERINRAGENLLGRSRDEIVGKTDADLFPSDEADAFMTADRAVLDGGELALIPVEKVDTATGTRLLRTKKVPIPGPDGTPAYLLGLSEDVTDAIGLSTELVAARDEAERANHAKSEFLSRMSHELRTPLNAILGFGQLLDHDDLTDMHQEAVDQILKGGRHLLGLINEVLDLARIETGRLSLSLESVRLDVAANEALDLIRPVAAQRQISLPDTLTGDWCHYVQGDQQRLRQVFLNLLSNAVKYNHEQGEITLECAVMPNNRFRASITDTGPGIADNQLSRMFIPFERLGAEGGTVEGTGLGLAVTKNLIEAMGGEMGVDSQLGVGSTFWIEIPSASGPKLEVNDGDQIAPVRQAGALVPGQTTILYVEDNQANILLVQRLVGLRPGTELVVAPNGEDGVRMALEIEPDLILLDLNLPGIDGAAVVSQLRTRHQTSDTPIIIISADANPTQITRLMDMGASDYLTKPIDIAEIIVTAEKFLPQAETPATPSLDEA